MRDCLRLPLPPELLRALPALAQRPGTVVLRRDERALLGWPVRGTVLLFDPLWSVTARNGGWECSGSPPSGILESSDAFGFASALARRLRRHPCGPLGVPLVAGWIGFEAGTAALGARHPVPSPGSPPDAWLGAYDCAVVAASGAVELVVRRLDPCVGHRAHDLAERAEEAMATLRSAADRAPAGITLDPDARVEALDRHWHRAAVRAVHDHLRAGDTYQVNLTGFVRVRTQRSAWSVFDTECAVNPVGYAAYVHMGEHTITSHSPELLLHQRAGRALTAPIKGTIAAAPGAEHGLGTSAKDRAEHVMIVDLCRNDLGRSARTGSVRVTALMRPLLLRGLVHLISEVSARPRPGAVDRVLADLFPGGSVTGAPKRRSCALVRVIERCGRGPYTGSIGVIDGRGAMDWNIAIRTALWHNGDAWFGCGGGIVLDSDPDREYDEAMLKAQSFLASARGSAAPLVLSSSGARLTEGAPSLGAP